MDFLTVVTPTFGNLSARRLPVLLDELRRFTRRPFKQIVCDDGTADHEVCSLQESICKERGVRRLSNPGPIHGASYNLRFLFDHVETPWAYLIEDGVRPSYGWLEAAVDWIKKVGSKEWCGHKVGMAGTAVMNEWLLAMGGAFPTRNSLADWFRATTLSQERFDEFYGPWNDGRWNWGRIADGVMRTCYYSDRAGWPDMIQQFANVMLTSLDPPHDAHDENMHQKFLTLNWTVGQWPQRRTSKLSWYGSPLAIINMEAFRSVGGFREGCGFFEGHLALRLWQAGFLVMAVETPPWLHFRGQGFLAAGEGKGPRPPYQECVREDFGFDVMRAPHAVSAVPLERRREINRLLGNVLLEAV